MISASTKTAYPIQQTEEANCFWFLSRTSWGDRSESVDDAHALLFVAPCRRSPSARAHIRSRPRRVTFTRLVSSRRRDLAHMRDPPSRPLATWTRPSPPTRSSETKRNEAKSTVANASQHEDSSERTPAAGCGLRQTATRAPETERPPIRFVA